MTIALLTALHALAAAAWVGGIFFAFMILRVTAPPEPPIRLALWSRVFTRFFAWVWVFIAVLVASGYGLLVQGIQRGWPVHAMQAIGWLMFVLFAWLSLHLLPAFKRALAQDALPAAAAIMAKMRPLIAVNLVLGVVTIAIGASARYLG